MDHLEDTLKMIKNAEGLINKVGLLGREGLKDISWHVGPMLSSRWMVERFPEYLPSQTQTPRILTHATGFSGTRGPIGVSFPDIDKNNAWERAYFVSHRPVETISEVLTALQRALVDTIHVLKKPGGRRPLAHRHLLLLNLAQIWHSILKRTGSTCKTLDFMSFCELVVEKLGWPTDGVIAAAQKALRDWRNRAGN